MSKRLKFIVATFVVSLLMSVVNRVVFILYNYTMIAAECSFVELLQCFRHGLVLDLSIAGYITALPLLSTIVTVWQPASWRKTKVWQRVMNSYFAVIVFIVAVIECGDIGLFEAWQARIDAQVFIYTPKEMMASLTLGNIIGALAYIGITVVVLFYLFSRITSRWFLPQLHEERYKPLRASAYTLILIIAAGLLFLVMRGGTTTATANVSKVHFSHRSMLNKIAINPIFSLIESATTGDDLARFDYFSFKKAEEIFANSLHRSDAQSDITNTRWLTTERPNIVVVVMEGMGCTITESYEGEEPVTPHLTALQDEGIWFENMYASSFRTDRGNVAIFSGFPGQPTMSIMKLAKRASKLPGIAAALNSVGYSTRFFYGGDSNFTNTRAYLYSTGYMEVIDEKRMSLDGHRSKWGYADDAVLDYAAEEIINRIESSDAPCFETILTLSSHEPYEVPYKRLEDARLNSFAYTDECIGNFVQRLRNSEVWDNMLLILVPDHSTLYPTSIGNHSSERHRIPMMWLGGAVREHIVVEEYMSQTDIAATLLAQLDIDHSEFIFSRDICAPGCAHFAYWTYPVGFGIIDSEGKTIYDSASDKVLVEEGVNHDERIEVGKAWLEKTFIEIRKM